MLLEKILEKERKGKQPKITNFLPSGPPIKVLSESYLLLRNLVLCHENKCLNMAKQK